MGKGFWDFMSDWVGQTAFEYTKITKIEDKPKRKMVDVTPQKKRIQLIRDGKTMVIDVDDYKLLDEAETKLIK